MKISKTIMSLGVASALTMQFSACQQTQHDNPLLQESTLPFGAPDFSKIDSSAFRPEWGIPDRFFC